MARMYGNDKCPSEIFGDSSQSTNWILDSGATCHMTPEVSYFITGSLKKFDMMYQKDMGIFLALYLPKH